MPPLPAPAQTKSDALVTVHRFYAPVNSWVKANLTDRITKFFREHIWKDDGCGGGLRLLPSVFAATGGQTCAANRAKLSRLQKFLTSFFKAPVESVLDWITGGIRQGFAEGLEETRPVTSIPATSAEREFQRLFSEGGKYTIVDDGNTITVNGHQLNGFVFGGDKIGAPYRIEVEGKTNNAFLKIAKGGIASNIAVVEELLAFLEISSKRGDMVEIYAWGVIEVPAVGGVLERRIWILEKELPDISDEQHQEAVLQSVWEWEDIVPDRWEKSNFGLDDGKVKARDYSISSLSKEYLVRAEELTHAILESRSIQLRVMPVVETKILTDRDKLLHAITQADNHYSDLVRKDEQPYSKIIEIEKDKVRAEAENDLPLDLVRKYARGLLFGSAREFFQTVPYEITVTPAVLNGLMRVDPGKQTIEEIRKELHDIYLNFFKFREVNGDTVDRLSQFATPDSYFDNLKKDRFRNFVYRFFRTPLGRRLLKPLPMLRGGRLYLPLGDFEIDDKMMGAADIKEIIDDMDQGIYQKALLYFLEDAIDSNLNRISTERRKAAYDTEQNRNSEFYETNIQSYHGAIVGFERISFLFLQKAAALAREQENGKINIPPAQPSIALPVRTETPVGPLERLAKKVLDRLKQLIDRCRTASVPKSFIAGSAGSFGTGYSHNADQNRQEQNNNHGEEEGYIETHRSVFLASSTLNAQSPMVVAIPNSITGPLILSTPAMSGDMTLSAKNTFSALSQILASRESWPWVSNGSWSTKMIPDRMYDEDITGEVVPSMGFRFLPQVYAVEGNRSSPGCSPIGNVLLRIASREQWEKISNDHRLWMAPWRMLARMVLQPNPAPAPRSHLRQFFSSARDNLANLFIGLTRSNTPAGITAQSISLSGPNIPAVSGIISRVYSFWNHRYVLRMRQTIGRFVENNTVVLSLQKKWRERSYYPVEAYLKGSLEPLPYSFLGKDDPERNKRIKDRLAFTSENNGFLPMNDPLVRLLNAAAEQMKPANMEPIRVLVAVNAEEVNAYALEENTLIFNQELINRLDTVEEVLAILAHEIVHPHSGHLEQLHQIKGYFPQLGAKRMFEGQADFELHVILNRIGINPFVFERATGKIGGSLIQTYYRPSIDESHGSDVERRLNSLLLSYIIDFPASKTTGGEHAIPNTWKHPTRSSRLDYIASGWLTQERKNIIRNLSPELLKVYLEYLAYAEQYPERGWDKIRHAYRRLLMSRLLSFTISVLEERIETAQEIAPTDRRRAFLMAFLSIPGLDGSPRMLKFLDVTDFSKEASEAYLRLYRSGTVYEAAGLPTPAENRFYQMVRLPYYFIFRWNPWRTKIIQSKGDTAGNTIVHQAVLYLQYLKQQLADDAEIFGLVQSDKIYQSFLELVIQVVIDEAPRGFFDQYRNRLLIIVEQFLAEAKDRGLLTSPLPLTENNFINRLLLTIRNISPYSIRFDNKTKKISTQIQSRAKELYEKYYIRPDAADLALAIEHKDAFQLRKIVLDEPYEALRKLAAVRVKKGPFTQSDSDWVRQELEKILNQNPPPLPLEKYTEVKWKWDALESLLGEQVTDEHRLLYLALEYRIRLITILTAGQNQLEVKIPLLVETFQNDSVLTDFRTLPTRLRERIQADLAHETKAPKIHIFEEGQSEIEGEYHLPVYWINQDNGRYIKYQDITNAEKILTDEVSRLVAPLQLDVIHRQAISDAISATTDPIRRIRLLSKVIDYIKVRYGTLNYSSSLVGNTVSAALYMEPFTKLFLSSVSLLTPDIIRGNPELAREIYLLLKQHLSKSYENMRLIGRLRTTFVEIFDIDRALDFLEDEAVDGSLDFESVELLLESKLKTRLEYRNIESRVTRIFDTLVNTKSNNIGVLATIDSSLSRVLKDSSDMLELLRAATNTSDNDTQLRTYLGERWWGLARGTDTIISPNSSGNLEIRGGLLQIPSFPTFLQYFYGLSQGEKILLVRKILLTSNGALLYNKPYQESLADTIVARLEDREQLAPWFRTLLLSVFRTEDPIKIFLPIGSSIAQIMFEPPRQAGSNQQAAYKIKQRFYGFDWAEDKKFTQDNIAGLLGSQSSMQKRELDVDPRTSSLLQNYNETLEMLRGSFGTVIGHAQKSDGPQTVVDLLLEAARRLGPVFVRLAQILPQIIDVGVESEERLSEMNDANPGQSKFTAFMTLEREAQHDPEIQKFLEEDLVYIDKRIGGGSLVTVYRILVRKRNENGQIVHGKYQIKVLKILNPNAEYKVKEAIGMLGRVLAELKKADPQRKKYYELVGQMVPMLEEWLLADINDETFRIFDPIYSASHDNYQASNGVRLAAVPVDGLNTKYVKLEQYVPLLQDLNEDIAQPGGVPQIPDELPGMTLNEVMNRMNDRRTPPGEQAYMREVSRQTVQAVAEDFARHIFDPLYKNTNGDQMHLEHSDITRGNVQTAFGGNQELLADTENSDTRYLIDRNFYTRLTAADAEFLRILIPETDNRKRLRLIVHYFLSLNENSVHRNEEEVVIRSLEQAFGIERLGEIAGIRTKENDVIQFNKILQALVSRGITIPSRMMIMFKNINAIEHLLRRLEIPRFAEIFRNVQHNGSEQDNGALPQVDNNGELPMFQQRSGIVLSSRVGNLISQMQDCSVASFLIPSAYAQDPGGGGSNCGLFVRMIKHAPNTAIWEGGRFFVTHKFRFPTEAEWKEILPMRIEGVSEDNAAPTRAGPD